MGDKVKIIDFKLYVRSVKISLSVFIAHNKALEDGNAKYPIRRLRRAICKTYDTYISTVNLAHAQENLFTQLSTHIVIAWLRGSTTTLSTDAIIYTPKPVPLLTFLLGHHVWVTSKIQVNFLWILSLFMVLRSRKSTLTLLQECRVTKAAELEMDNSSEGRQRCRWSLPGAHYLKSECLRLY